MIASKEICTVHVTHSSTYSLIVYCINWDVFCDHLFSRKHTATLHNTKKLNKKESNIFVSAHFPAQAGNAPHILPF